MNDDLITTAEAAALLGKSVATINRWAASDKLPPAITIPGERGARLYRRTAIEALLAAPTTEVSA